MKLRFITFLLLFIGFVFSISGQDCNMLYPLKDGTVIEYQDFDAKDKLTGSSIQTISKVVEDGDNISVGIDYQGFDKKGENLLNGNFEVRCVDGTFYMDMKNMLDAATLSAYEGMEVEVNSNDLAYPSDMNAGTQLPDADITVGISSNGVKMFTMTVFVTNRLVEAIEDITTPAGTFECYKTSFDMETKMMVKVQAKSTQWIAEDIGMVRTENYNKKGKLQGYTILSKIY